MNKIKIVMVLLVFLFIGSYFVYDYVYEKEGYVATKENKDEVSKYPGSSGGAVGDYVDDMTNITGVIDEIEDAFGSGGYLDQGNFDGGFN